MNTDEPDVIVIGADEPAPWRPSWTTALVAIAVALGVLAALFGEALADRPAL